MQDRTSWPWLLAAVLAVTVVGSASVEAQEQGQVWITISHPTTVGVIWHITDRIAARTTVGWARSVSENEYQSSIPAYYDDLVALGLIAPNLPGPYRTETTGTSTDVNLSALFYLSRTEGLSTYVTPRYSYQRTTSKVEVDRAFPLLLDEQTRAMPMHAVAGSLGLQYAPVRRFSVFAEVGLEHTRRNYALESGSETTGRTLGIDVALGATLYLGD